MTSRTPQKTPEGQQCLFIRKVKVIHYYDDIIIWVEPIALW